MVRVMGKIFTLTSDIKSIVTDALDDIITELGKDCRLYYPATMSDCPNCEYDSMAGKSANRYTVGGPIPFEENTMCPVCAGVGELATEATEVIRMLCRWNPKEFLVYAGNIRVPYSVVETKCHLIHLPKIKQATHMIVQLPIEGYQHYSFKLASEPVDKGNIIQGRYCVAAWERAG